MPEAGIDQYASYELRPRFRELHPLTHTDFIYQVIRLEDGRETLIGQVTPVMMDDQTKFPGTWYCAYYKLLGDSFSYTSTLDALPNIDTAYQWVKDQSEKDLDNHFKMLGFT